MSEPFLTTWRRRAVTIPMMLFATLIAILGAPLLVPAAIVADLLRGRWQFPTLRVYLFILQYLINDSVEILAAPGLWLASGAGLRLDSPASIARHERLQWWSASLLARRAEQLLGLRLDADESVDASLDEGPVIVISRHVSPFDASLPGLVAHRAGFGVRAVIMEELLADPGFDLLYRRLGSAFIPRDDASAAIDTIRSMTAQAREDTAIVIFPEGRLFTPAARDRALARLADRDPERATRLAGLTNMLPPRPRGLLALIDDLPSADIVVLEHAGLDGLRSIGDLLRLAPMTEPVLVTARRFARTELPCSSGELEVWLDELWLSLDGR